MSLDNISWIAASVPFNFYHSPVFSSVTPTMRYSEGYTLITINGIGLFDSGLEKCRFRFPNCGSDVILVPATFISSSTITCISPPYVACAAVSLDVTLNSFEYVTATTSISYINTPEVTSITPSYSLWDGI